MMLLIDAIAFLLLAMIWKREDVFNISLWLTFVGLFVTNAILAAPFAMHLAGAN